MAKRRSGWNKRLERIISLPVVILEQLTLIIKGI